MFLRIVNLSIAVLLLVFLGLFYWFGWRTLPEISGTVQLPVSAAATITRDAQGVPHIRAANADDAIFLEGYAMAQDRLWQLDALRRRAAGELAEVAGPAALPADQEARSLGIARIVEEREASLAPTERAAFAAFARGVNAYIDTHRGRLPMEFAILGYDPRPWRVQDSMLAGMEMYRTLTNSWRAELNKQQMLARGDHAKVEFLLPANNGNDPQPGSNAWVITGAHTASGKPILANDPHLEFALPSPWYLVHIDAPDLHVTGATIVGLPGVIIGHNQNVAWGVTNLEFDVQDLYHEQIDVQTGRYRFRDTVEQARPFRDIIAVKGAAPVAFNTWITRHGPLFLNESGQQYALHWAPADAGGFTFPFLAINRARNWEEFRAALSSFVGPGQNFVYADTAGHIGYQAAGRLPIRKNCGGDTPSEGATGDCEWDGFIPFDDLPSSYDPPSGMFVTANQSTFLRNPAYKINGNFGAPYRSQQITARLASREKWQTGEMLGIQTDVYSAFGVYLAKEIVAAFDRVKPREAMMAQAVDTLRHWDGQMGKRQAAPMVVMLTFDQLRKQAVERAAPAEAEQYQTLIPALAIERLLRQKPANWFPDYDQLLMRCLTGAIEVGRTTQGSQISRWNWGQYQALTISHPIGSRLPVLGRYFNIGPVAMGGAPTTVAQYTGRLGPSLRMGVDLGDLENSYINLPAGESDQRLSLHYKDQWDAYYAGRSFPMQFAKVNADKVLNVTPAN